MIGKQFILVTLTASLTSVFGLILAKFLDQFINKSLSNFIAGIIDLSIDFLFQSFIFLHHIKQKNYRTILKYMIFRTLSLFLNQALFMLYMEYLYDENIEITIIRIILGMIEFTLVYYPISKYIIFTK